MKFIHLKGNYFDLVVIYLHANNGSRVEGLHYAIFN
jgi:hypothetical protein